MKNRGLAIVLCLFFGGLGFHKFYLGKGGLGVLYLFFCWTFVPLVLSIIDLLVLLSLSEKQFNEKYNKEAVLKEEKNDLLMQKMMDKIDKLEK